jgi:hypothetical protein
MKVPEHRSDRPASAESRAVVDLAALDQLIPSLVRRGFQVIGPTMRDGAIVYGNLRTLQDLPASRNAMMGLYSAMSSDRRAGRSFFTRRKRDYSKRSAMGGASGSSTTPLSLRVTPSSESVPVNWPPYGCKTGY